jgi:hypothetical protein
MRTFPVGLAIRFAFLCLALGLTVSIADSAVLADECHDDCQNTYNSCTLSATLAYNSCEESADSALNGCETWADWDFDDNVETYCGGWTWTACIQAMEGIRTQAYGRCQDTYASSLATCQDNEDSADATCSSNLANCEDNCP